MTCPVCGTPYPCAHSRGTKAVFPDSEIHESKTAGAPGPSSPAAEARSRAEQEYWRREVALRVRQHRARRRRFDTNASLELDFPSETALAIAPDLTTPVLSPPVDELILNAGRVESTLEIEAAPPVETAAPLPRKIIRFPGSAAAEAPAARKPSFEELELAEPAPESPRILDAPGPEAEQMELLPSFADIRLEEAPPANSLSEELDSLPQPAPLRQRLASGVVDSGIVLFAVGLFAVTFAEVAESAPSSRAAMLCALAVGGTLWLLFQYLFLVYGAGTPGMRTAHLELFGFDGRRASVFARQARALATTLSGLSVGLGFAWALVDEDALGWHDRISQTYLRSEERVIR